MDPKTKQRIDELSEEVSELEMARDVAIDEGDMARVHELELEIEALNADIANMERR